MDDLYQLWLRLRLSHGHLSTPEGIRRSLSLQPCPDTARVLRQLELVMCQEAEGCGVLVTPKQRPALAAWLERSGGGPLQWRLVARQGSIWGCTAVPLEARCRQWHLHGRPTTGQTEGALSVRLLPVVERQLTLTPPKAARSLRWLDGQGQVLGKLPLNAADVGAPLVVSLASLPEGLIQPDLGGKRPLPPFLHLAPQPNAIGLVSLWLPVTAALAANPLEWVWPLPGRETIWHYLLVPRRAGDALTGLRVEGEGCAFSAATAPETLADGRRAWRLVGERALPLLERSALRFRLEGQRLDADGQSHRLVVDPLPVAPAEPVWPGSGDDPLVGVSEMLVPV
ncbi:MAG: hypothetical protein VKO39_05770 [Cyanobacteriota bacterium]|nr:hypothetical protein [Cyanobacteriota bacterium]